MVLLSLKTLRQLRRGKNLQHAWVLQHVSIANRRILGHMKRIKPNSWKCPICKVCSSPLQYGLHVTLITSHSVCFCKEHKKERTKQHWWSDISTMPPAPLGGHKKTAGCGDGGKLGGDKKGFVFFLQRCSKLTELPFDRRTRCSVQEERTTCPLDMPKYWDRAFKRGEYLIKAQSRSP